MPGKPVVCDSCDGRVADACARQEKFRRGASNGFAVLQNLEDEPEEEPEEERVIENAVNTDGPASQTAKALPPVQDGTSKNAHRKAERQ